MSKSCNSLNIGPILVLKLFWNPFNVLLSPYLITCDERMHILFFLIYTIKHFYKSAGGALCDEIKKFDRDRDQDQDQKYNRTGISIDPGLEPVPGSGPGREPGTTTGQGLMIRRMYNNCIDNFILNFKWQ